MTRRRALALSLAAAVTLAGCASGQPVPVTPASSSPAVPPSPPADLRSDLDRIFDSPALARALVAVKVESLSSGAVLYERNADKLVVPASNMKIITVAAAASRLGWDYRYETALEAVGVVTDGTLDGDLVVTGSGDPSIGSPDGGHAALFLEWATALQNHGIRRITGRIVGDDSAFAGEPLGAGWAWDYLAAGYAAPSGALSYNENVSVIRVSPGPSPGAPAIVSLAPPGHLLVVTNETTTTDRGSAVSLELTRLPGDHRLVARGRIPIGTATLVRTASVDNPTRYFVEAFRLALLNRGVIVRGDAVDIDDVPPRSGARTRVATHFSAPLSSLAGYAMKVSQNFYGEMFFKTLGRQPGLAGSIEGGRQAIRASLTEWDLPLDSVVPYDGSGLSRYNFVTANTIAAVLKHVWQDERLRGPYLAALPVGGRDGTLETRMKGADLDRRVQAKTGTIANVRSLSGYLDAASGDTLVFSMIANNFTASTAEIDAVMERALLRCALLR